MQHKSHNDEECAERGAIGVIVQNNAAGSPPPGMAGCDATITIRTVMITQADGAKFRDFLRFRSRTHSGMLSNIGVDPNIRQAPTPRAV